MKSFLFSFFLLILFSFNSYAQDLDQAKELYKQGKFSEALPTIEKEYNIKPNDPSLNQWYGVCLYETGGDLTKAESCLLLASQKGIQESYLYLGLLYTDLYQFDKAESNLLKYKTLLSKKKKDLASNASLLEDIELKLSLFDRLNRMASNTEDIQIIDSIVVNKSNLLSGYPLSLSSGSIQPFKDVFKANKPIESTVYFNEKGSKIYFGQPDKNGSYTLFSMDKLLDKYGNEKKLSSNNFGLTGDVNYPFVMPDGITIYFSAKDEESIGGYDLFVTRYNMNNDTYLNPERMNMPFNSIYNDYMMVIDEEKGVGWFASDRYQPEGKVCIYTFIPNESVKLVESDDHTYKLNRARIKAIKDSQVAGQDYSSIINRARQKPVAQTKEVRDFEFVINDDHTYYVLSDFKNASAKDTYYKAIQLKSDMSKLDNDLNTKRESYSKANNNTKVSMSKSILDMEQKLEQLQWQVADLEMQARNEELRSLKK